MNRILTGVIPIFLFLIYGCQTTTKNSSDALNQLFREDWEYQLKSQPLFATYIGDHRYNDRLADLSMRAISENQKMDSVILARLAEIDRGTLSKSDQVNYDLFKRQKELERV